MPYGTVNADLMTTSDGVSSSGLYGFKNRLINGNFAIDQRNAGASVTAVNAVYTLDRWQSVSSAASKFSVQQNAGSVTPPAGFKNYIGVTSSSAYSVGAGEVFALLQPIEGFNTADLGFGAAGASTVTLSFWVRSSLTGTFGGALSNGATTRSYPFSYTISSANTWEQKSVTIAGDTSGTWVGATNGTGLNVQFSLGTGTSLSGTAGSWYGSFYGSATGATSVVGTNGATFYITGVQLEKGSTATSFDYRPYSLEFSMCQRYYQKVTTAENAKGISTGYYYTSTVFISQIPFQTYMRATPTLDVNSGTNYFILYTNGAGDGFDTVSLNDANQYTMAVTNTTQVSGTAGMAGQFKTNSASASLAFSSEL
jgi:hypothetical protein